MLLIDWIKENYSLELPDSEKDSFKLAYAFVSNCIFIADF